MYATALLDGGGLATGVVADLQVRADHGLPGLVVAAPIGLQGAYMARNLVDGQFAEFVNHNASHARIEEFSSPWGNLPTNGTGTNASALRFRLDPNRFFYDKPCTLSAWIWYYDNEDNYAYFMCMGPGTAPNYNDNVGLATRNLGGRDDIMFDIRGTTNRQATEGAGAAVVGYNTLTHVVGVSDGNGGMTLYLDGVSEATASGAAITAGQPLDVLNLLTHVRTDNSWNGDVPMADAHLFEGALSAHEVNWLCQQGVYGLYEYAPARTAYLPPSTSSIAPLFYHHRFHNRAA